MKIDDAPKYLQAVIDGIPDPVLVIAKDFTVSFMNQAAKATFDETGLSSVEKHYCHRILHGQDTPCGSSGDACPLVEVFKTGKPFKTVHQHTDRGINGPLLEVSASPILGTEGEVIEVVEIMRDVTEKENVEQYWLMAQRLSNLVESTAEAIVSVDTAGTIIHANEATSRIFGYSSTDLTQMSLTMLIPGSFQAMPVNDVQGASAFQDFNNIGEKVELTALRKDGTKFPVKLSLSTWKTDGTVYFTAIIDDISKRKKAEEALRESREALLKEHEELVHIFNYVEIAKQEWERTMDCVDDMLILTDNNGSIKRCNRSFTKFIMKKYDEIIGKSCSDLLKERGMTVGEHFTRETEIFYQPSHRWFVINTYPVNAEKRDQTSGMVISIHDTTQLKRATEELERTNSEIEGSRQNLRAALDELSFLIQEVENEKTFSVRYSNPDLIQCYKKKNCAKTDCPCYGKDTMRCWQIAGTHCGGKVQGDFAQKIDNCTACDVFKVATSDPIYQIGEHFNNMMHILEMKNAELEHAYEELKVSHTKILQQEKMASIGQLAAGVAHEINNPIGFVSSNISTLSKYVDRFTEFIRAQQDVIGSCTSGEMNKTIGEARKRLKLDFIADDAKKLIAESLDGADRVKRIVQNLKSFSRVDQTEYKLADINECMETTLIIVWNELKYKTTLKKDYGTLPLTKCYPQQLNQVFLNLLMNAAQAIETQGEIAIKTWHKDRDIFVSVSDTGTGIPEQNLTKIFEPFFTTKEVGKGTGLGLSITYEIVKKHNGDIIVESTEGTGTTFTIRIPVVEEN